MPDSGRVDADTLRWPATRRQRPPSRLDLSLWLVAAAGASVGLLLMMVLVRFAALGFWLATGTAGASIVALLVARRFDAASGHDDDARRRLSLRVAVAGIGAGIVAAAAFLEWRAEAPFTLAAAGVLLLATGYRAYRTEAYRQHMLEAADV